MLIQNLPAHIRVLAEQRRREQPEFHNDGFSKKMLRGAFQWDETPEGFDWWDEIDKEHFDTPYPPHALKMGQEVCSIYKKGGAITDTVFIGYWDKFYWCFDKKSGIVGRFTSAFPVIKPTLTIKEIAEWKGVTEDEAREMIKQIL